MCDDSGCSIPYGECHCGCGRLTTIPKLTNAVMNRYVGVPMKWLPGHNHRHTQDYWLVDKSTGCWEWQLKRNPGGYGQKSLGRGVMILAHRWVYEQQVGPIPDGMTLDHLCRNRGCVNPAHLEPVTIKVNILRSDGLAAINARKDHCIRGHAFDEVNTVMRSGKRQCRQCEQIRWARSRAKRALRPPNGDDRSATA